MNSSRSSEKKIKLRGRHVLKSVVHRSNDRQAIKKLKNGLLLSEQSKLKNQESDSCEFDELKRRYDALIDPNVVVEGNQEPPPTKSENCLPEFNNHGTKVNKKEKNKMLRLGKSKTQIFTVPFKCNYSDGEHVLIEDALIEPNVDAQINKKQPLIEIENCLPKLDHDNNDAKKSKKKSLRHEPTKIKKLPHVPQNRKSELNLESEIRKVNSDLTDNESVELKDDTNDQESPQIESDIDVFNALNELNNSFDVPPMNEERDNLMSTPMAEKNMMRKITNLEKDVVGIYKKMDSHLQEVKEIKSLLKDQMQIRSNPTSERNVRRNYSLLPKLPIKKMKHVIAMEADINNNEEYKEQLVSIIS